MKKLMTMTLVIFGFSLANAQITVHQNMKVLKQYELPIDNCINESWVHLSTRLISKGVCQVTQPLSLEKVSKYYPLMGMSFHVQYWSFAAQRTDRYLLTYRRYITNVCTRRQVGADFITRKEFNTVEFAIQNPNLSNKIAHSYEILPMTDSEARQAADQAISACSH